MKFILSVHVLLRACRRWCSKKSPVVLTVSSMDCLTTIKNQGTIASVRGKKKKRKEKKLLYLYILLPVSAQSVKSSSLVIVLLSTLNLVKYGHKWQ